MSGDSLGSVVESVQDWADSRSDWGESTAARTALVVSCSMSNCRRGPPWPVEAARTVVGVRTLGNQTWDRSGDRVELDGDIDHLETRHDITAVLVVGHTRCRVLENAYDRWTAPASERPTGIEARLAPLRSLVGDAFDEGHLTDAMPPRTVRSRLVEYNVRRQVGFLGQALPASVTVAGYVRDQNGAYGSFPDKRYLVALDGATEPTAIRTRLPEDASVQVASLLS